MGAVVVSVNDRMQIRRMPVEGILSYDADNAYPQRIMSIINASGTAAKCVNILSKFIRGGGFADATFYKAVVNEDGETNDMILRKITQDYAMFRGFALHVNYDMNGKIVEVYHVPFEHCRFKADKETLTPYAIAVYRDWNRRLYSRIKTEQIKEFDFFNPDTAVIEGNAQGWNNYKGQIFYYSPDGMQYPLSTADPVIEDCVTEAEIKSFKWRNVTTNFMASHIYVHRGNFEDPTQRAEMQEVLQQFQGAQNASRMMMVESTDETQDPKLLKVDIQDSDKLFEYTEGSVQNNIRSNYGVPPILVGRDVSVGFATDIMQQAYTYVSHITTDDRIMLEEVFRRIFSYWTTNINPTNNYSIIPLTYGTNNNG